ncbi:MAG: hypothetical protein BalsKO_07930 [Balneolaceae bacterium]
MKNLTIQNRISSLLLKLTEPKKIEGFFSNLVLALPRILGGFFLATMFGGDKFGVPWSFSDTGLGLFEVVDWFPEDVAQFGFPFSEAPVLFAWLGAASEAIGGMFLLLGFQTRISAFLISCTMLGAIFLQKWGGPLWNMLPAMSFLWISLYAMVFGSGKFGLDYLVAKKWKAYVAGEKLAQDKPKVASMIGLALIFSLCSFSGVNAQIKGSGEITTQKIEVEAFTKIKNGLSSDYIIQIGDESEVKITLDKNLIDHIQVEVNRGELYINQKEWISSTKKIKVEITVPNLIQFTNSAHGLYKILDINNEAFKIDAPVGELFLTGKTKELIIDTKVGDIDASRLTTNNAKLSISSFGTIYVNALGEVDAKVSGNGKVVYSEEPQILKSKTEEGGKIISAQENTAPAKEIVYINLKLKNNSSDRVKLVFVGPENARFSYGVTLNIYQARKERFPVGTKVYLERALWKNQLLAEIKEEDAGQTVNLF